MPERYNSKVIRTPTPDGSLFMIVMENDKGDPCEFEISIGKSGTRLRAWTYAVSRLLTIAIRNGATLEEIITELSNTTSDKYVLDSKNVPVRSGPDGIVLGLLKYRGAKYEEMQEELQRLTGDRRKKRGPSLNQR